MTGRRYHRHAIRPIVSRGVSDRSDLGLFGLEVSCGWECLGLHGRAPTERHAIQAQGLHFLSMSPSTTFRSRRMGAAGGWIVLAILSTACSEAVAPELPELPAAVEARLREDAARFVLRDWRSEGSLRDFPVEIPSSEIEERLRPLVWVHDAEDLAARDSVVEIFQIRTAGFPELHMLFLALDPTEPWVDAWFSDQLETGNFQVDTLTKLYSLELVDMDVNPAGSLAFATLRSPNRINVAALAARFEGVPGVTSAGPAGGVTGPSHDIELQTLDDGWRVEYVVGWGDCPSGCIFHHRWSFFVTRRGDVRLVGIDGPSIPTGEF